jgi:hypothetical protein
MVACGLLAETPDMIKRIAIGAVWFLTIGWGFSFLNLVIGVPSVVGLALAAAGSAFVVMDPLHLIWPVATTVSAKTTRTAVISPSGAMQTQV